MRLESKGSSMGEKTFSRMIGTLRRRWQAGLLLCDVLRAAGLAIVVLTVYGLLDWFAAFGPIVSLVLDAALLAVLIALFLGWLARSLRLSNGDMARRADRLLNSRRRAMLSALELESWLAGRAGAGEGFQEYLAGQSVDEAGRVLKGVKFGQYFPLPEIGQRLRILLLQVCVAAVVFYLNSDALQTALTRILFPLRDTPPYSRYVFSVSPKQPRVIYGGNAEVSVEITGAPVKSQVWFVTRYKGKTHRTACFQESGQRFAQKLEKVVSPLEFCFATGKARSRWHQVDLLLQPEIASALVTIVPPQYTGLPRRQFPAGKEDLAGYKHSRVELFLTSNRPLSEGLLTIRPKTGLEGDKPVKAVRTGANSVSFNWILQEPADLDVAVHDIRGTKNRTPFKIEQKLIPDKPPQAAITEPAAFALATPRTTVPLSGHVSDDLGLQKVELVRTVVGYRDRMTTLGPETPDRRFDFARKVNLKTIGAQPGQVLEFYLEASDSNPAMTGVTASDVVRVQIISEEDYAVMLRARTSVDEFMRRYQVAAEEMKRLKEALRALKDAASSKDRQQADIEKKLAAVKDQMKKTAGLFDKMAVDFPVYDAEKILAGAVSDLSGLIRQNLQKLEQAAPPYTTAGQLADEALNDLGGKEQELEGAVADAEKIALIARVMECAVRFKDVLNRQSELVRRLERFGHDPGTQTKDLKLLAALGQRQKEIAASLSKVIRDIRVRAALLPNDLRNLRLKAQETAELTEQYGVQDLMDKAVGSAENQDGGQTHHFATLAMEKLKQVLADSSGNEFSDLYDGRMGVDVKQGLKSTLEQMLAALQMLVSGSGAGGTGMTGTGGGGTVGGDMNDGYWARGSSPLNMPVFGPERMSFPDAAAGSAAGATGAGAGAAGKGPGSARTSASEAMERRGETEVKSRSLPLENVPDKYRNAVKKYFSEEEKDEQ